MKRNNINKTIYHLALTFGLSLLFIMAGVDSSYGQSAAPKTQSVRVVNTLEEPVPVKIIENGTARTPFQNKVFVGCQGGAFTTTNLLIPEGKRLVIKNVSAIAHRPEGRRMEIKFFSHFENGDGIFDYVQDRTFHRVLLVDQGAFGGLAVSMANHKVLVFADERIGGQTGLTVGVQCRLDAGTTGFVQGEVTFSGYIEDLPSVP